MCFPDGYVAVDHVELDIKEMLELGKKAAENRKSSNNLMDEEVPRNGSRYMSSSSLTTHHSSRSGVEQDDLELFVSLFLRESNHYPHSESCKYPIFSLMLSAWSLWCSLMLVFVCVQSQMTVRSGLVRMMKIFLLPMKL